MTYNYDYRVGVPVRVTAVPAGDAGETETNNATSNANALALSNTSAGHITATAAGHDQRLRPRRPLHLGNLTAGVSINLSHAYQDGARSRPKVEILYSSAGSVRLDADGDPNDGPAQFVTNVAGTYYARVTSRTGNSGLLAQYLLDLDLRAA